MVRSTGERKCRRKSNFAFSHHHPYSHNFNPLCQAIEVEVGSRNMDGPIPVCPAAWQAGCTALYTDRPPGHPQHATRQPCDLQVAFPNTAICATQRGTTPWLFLLAPFD